MSQEQYFSATNKKMHEAEELVANLSEIQDSYLELMAYVLDCVIAVERRDDGYFVPAEQAEDLFAHLDLPELPPNLQD